MAGKALRGNTISNGEYGLVATEPCWIKSNQIEAARVAMTRYIKRGGKVWIKIFQMCIRDSYSTEDIQIFLCIQELKKKGYQLKEIKEVIPLLMQAAAPEEDKDRQLRFYEVLDRLMQELKRQRRQEDRYKRVDEAIRQHQIARKQVEMCIRDSTCTGTAVLQQIDHGGVFQNGKVGALFYPVDQCCDDFFPGHILVMENARTGMAALSGIRETAM